MLEVKFGGQENRPLVPDTITPKLADSSTPTATPQPDRDSWATICLHIATITPYPVVILVALVFTTGSSTTVNSVKHSGEILAKALLNGGIILLVFIKNG